jgi:hypothetical protein
MQRPDDSNDATPSHWQTSGQRPFRRAVILILVFPVFACVTYLTSIVQEHPFIAPSVLPLLFWPIGVPFLVLFIVSGLGLLGQRRWATTLVVITLALLLVVEWSTCLVMLTPMDFVSFIRLPALGWVVAAVVHFGAVGLFAGRRWMTRAAARALPILAIGLWAVGLVLLLTVGPGHARNTSRATVLDDPAAVASMVITVLSNSILLAYPLVMLILCTRWSLHGGSERGSGAATG